MPLVADATCRVPELPFERATCTEGIYLFHTFRP
jgi:hypothetical protein